MKKKLGIFPLKNELVKWCVERRISCAQNKSRAACKAYKAARLAIRGAPKRTRSFTCLFRRATDTQPFSLLDVSPRSLRSLAFSGPYAYVCREA